MTTPGDDRRAELEAMLREAVPTLAPPEGSWEQISKRARRRRTFKATLSVAAGVIIVAGAVPAVIAVRSNSGGDQSLNITNSAGPKPSVTTNATTPPTPPPAQDSALAGFYPDSVSFITQEQGFALGSVGADRRAVVAETLNAGKTWVERTAPHVDDAALVTGGHRSVSQVRFSVNGQGFLYGSSYWYSDDFGIHWTKEPSPGYIDALETRNGHVWALARQDRHSPYVSLYEATTKNPVLHRVPGVPTMRGRAGTSSVAGAASLAVSDNGQGTHGHSLGTRVVAMVGHSGVTLSPTGKHWVSGDDPCQKNPASTALAISGGADVVAACGYGATNDAQVKQTFTSANGGRTWKATAAQPSSAGYLSTLAGGTTATAMVGVSRGSAQFTDNGGRKWSPSQPPDDLDLSFVGYINLHYLVAVADRDDVASGTSGAFASSTDDGATWTVTRFPAGTP